MKILTIELGGRKYASSHITAYLSREAMKLNRDALELGKLGRQVQESPDIDAAEKLMDEMLDLSERKAQFICEVYGRKFTAEELEKELSAEEIDAELQKVMLGISGIISKN